MNTTDVSEDGCLCAVVSNSHVNIYDVCNSTLICTIKNESQDTKTKMVKISPPNDSVAWLMSSPNQLSLIHIHSKLTSKITPHTDNSFEYVLWNPDGKNLAAFSTLSLFIDVYRIEQDNATHIASISGAKFDNFGCPLAQFSYDGDYFCTLNICNQGHCITIYNTLDSSWNCVQRMFISGYQDVGGLLWCRDSASLLLWQSGPRLLLQLWTLYGHMEHELTADAEPISNVCFSNCGRMAAVHSRDGRVRILDLLTWELGVVVYVHCAIVHKSYCRTRLKEKVNHRGSVIICESITTTLLELNHDASSSERRLLQFSADTQYLATYEPVYPNTLWIWNLTSDPPLDTVVVLGDETCIYGLLWHNQKTILAASLRNRVLVWTPKQTIVVSQSENLWPLTAENYFVTQLPDFDCDRFSDNDSLS